MNTVQDHDGIIRAIVAPDGTLESADPAILALQTEAGGALCGPLLVPQLAALARLASRLNIAVSRPVIAAADNADIDMWVRAKPQEGQIHIAIIDWRERPPRAISKADDANRQHDFIRQQPGWSWQVDTRMRFVMVEPSSDNSGGDVRPQVGSLFTSFFDLQQDEYETLPILQALAEHRPFLMQPAIRKDDTAEKFILSGLPVSDSAGRLIGYRGKAQRCDVVEAPPEVSASEDVAPVEYSPVFGQRLNRALRQPLGRIIANADTISSQLQGPLRRDYAAYASDIALAGRHLMELVDDLADLQAIERPGFTTAAEDVDLADIARRTAGLLGVRAADKNIRIDAPHLGESVVATGEFRRTLQIMVNLVGNAVRYSPDGSKIWIRVDEEGDEASVTVADQGRGISEEDQQRIFDKFERLGRDEAGGSGLGLYISRRLATAMGGTLTVESAPGQGARFTLRLSRKAV